MEQLSVFLTTLLLLACPLYGKTYDTYNQYYDPRQRNPDYDLLEKYRRYDNYEPPMSPFRQTLHTFIADYGPAPPPPDQVAKMARYIVHNADWAGIATHSFSPAIRGFPFANIISISDGTATNSSGVPYMYVTSKQLSTRDLEIDPRCSLAVSLAVTEYCKQQNLDPEDPRCARVLLTGKIIRLKNNTSEHDYAENAVLSRHPAMRSWPRSHEWYFAKFKIGHIVVLDYFGGPKIVPVPEYFNPGDAHFRI